MAWIEPVPVEGYRIVEIKKGRVYSLFHATGGSREILLEQWYKHQPGVVRDGSGGDYYQAGWHFLKTKEEARDFFDRMFRIKDHRYVIRCWVWGHIREKDHSVKGHCWLADEIYIMEHDVLEALRGN
jgi:hypothetical protein